MKKLFMIATLGCYSGCASWISDPSPATRSLVEYFKYEGFGCKAEMAAIVCESKSPILERSPKVCSSSKGCIKTEDHQLFTRYTITQGHDGVPQLKSSVRRVPAQ